MKTNEKKELENQINILKFERDSLHRNYINARQDAVAELLNLLLDEPYSFYIDDKIVFEIAAEIYGLQIKNGRVKNLQYMEERK
ncbi:MAG: hypothetical protein IJ981_03200 [Clostridia bacterium]|nr:hypothetical protein [Clostridia bacterium]